MAQRTTTIEVPVQRLAEFVSASFTACDDNENNPLNMDEARWYRTGEDAITLVVGAGGTTIAFEFKASALGALTKHSSQMSVADIDQLLDL